MKPNHAMKFNHTAIIAFTACYLGSTQQSSVHKEPVAAAHLFKSARLYVIRYTRRCSRDRSPGAACFLCLSFRLTPLPPQNKKEGNYDISILVVFLL